MVLKGAPGRISCIAFSPDGRLLAAGGGDRFDRGPGTVTIWDIGSGAAQAPVQLDAHPKSVMRVGFSPDGRSLATTSLDGTVRLWDTTKGGIPTRRAVLRHNPHGRPVFALAFSPEGRMLASGDIDNSIKIWRAADGQLIGTLLGHTRIIVGLAFSPCGGILASVGKDRRVRLWSLATKRQLAALEGHHNEIRSVAFSPDGKTVATGSDDATVRLWSIAGLSTQSPASWVPALRQHPAGTRRHTGPRPVTVLRGHEGGVHAVVFSPDGTLLATGSADGTVRLWNPAAGDEADLLGGGPMRVPAGYRYVPNQLGFSADGRLLTSGGGGHPFSLDRAHDLRVFDAATEHETLFLRGGGEPARFAVFSPWGGALLATASRLENTVRLWRVADGREVGVLAGHTGRVCAAAFSPETGPPRKRAWLATGSYDETIRLWDVGLPGGHARPAAVLKGHTGQVMSVAFSPDGRLLASGSADDMTVRLWSVPEGRQVAVFRGHRQPVWSVAFSPNGQTIASGSLDSEVKLWQVRRGVDQESATLRGHQGMVYAIAFSPDGKTLASGSSDYTVKLWNLATRREVATLKGHDEAVFGVAFSPDGNTLVSGSSDATVRIWRASSR